MLDAAPSLGDLATGLGCAESADDCHDDEPDGSAQDDAPEQQIVPATHHNGVEGAPARRHSPAVPSVLLMVRHESSFPSRRLG